jgi:hypothetical protein
MHQWGSIVPSNDREWRPEVAVLPHATIAGNFITVHNIRNFDYRTETGFTPAYYDKTFDLSKYGEAQHPHYPLRLAQPDGLRRTAGVFPDHRRMAIDLDPCPSLCEKAPGQQCLHIPRAVSDEIDIHPLP